MNKHLILAAAGLVAVAALSGCGTKVKDVPSNVATVNGEKISSSTYLEEVNRRYGKEALANMIEQKILVGWAKKEKVAVTDAQVKKQIEILKADGTYDEQAKTMGEASIAGEIQAVQARINLAKKFYKFDDKQLEQIYQILNTQARRFVHGKRKQAQILIGPDKATMDEALKEANDGMTFEEIAAKHTLGQGGQNPVKFWVDETDTRMPAALSDAVKKTDVNKVGASVVEVKTGKGPAQYLLIKVLKQMGSEDRSFEKAKGEVLDAAALNRAQNDPDFQTRFEDQKKKAKIEIVPSYLSDVKFRFKYPAPQMPQMMGMPQGGAPQ